MEDFKTKHDSKIRKTISRIAGTDRITGRIMKSGPTGRKERPRSLLSFLPSMLDNGSVECSHRNSAPATVDATAVVQRPPPFFHSQPLPGTPETIHKGFTDQIADSSLSSLGSEEIARWKISKPLPDARTPHSRFGFLKSLLHLDKMQPTTSPDPGEVGNTPTSTPDSSVSVEYLREAPGFPLLRDHPFATQDCMRGSRTVSRSLDINILSPPPRFKRASIDATNPLVSRKANTRVAGLPGIDPTKWAEISISAADLVREYGRENVIFGAALECPSDDSLEEEEGVRDLSFFEMEDECGPLQSSPYTGGEIHRSKSNEGDPSATASSMAGSMTSLSKWPLPPDYENFEVNSAVP